MMNRPPAFALRSLDRVLLQAARIPFCTLTLPSRVRNLQDLLHLFLCSDLGPFPLVHLFAGAPKAGFLLQFVSGFEQKIPDLLLQMIVFEQLI